MVSCKLGKVCIVLHVIVKKKEENRVLKKLNFWDKLDHINVKKNEQAFFATYFQHNKKNGKNRFLSNTEGSFNSMDNTTLTIIT